MLNRITALATALLLLTCACSSSRPSQASPRLLGDRCSPDDLDHARRLVFDEAAARELTEEAQLKLADKGPQTTASLWGRRATLSTELYVTGQGDVACVRYMAGDDRLFSSVAFLLHTELKLTPPGIERAPHGLLLPLDVTISWDSNGGDFAGGYSGDLALDHASLFSRTAVKFAGAAARARVANQ